jgi:hypothetical protein
MAQQLICNRLSIPLTFLRKCPPDIQAKNLNYFLGRERNEELFLRFDGNSLRAVFSPRYRSLDNIVIIERLDRIGYSPETPVQLTLDENMMQINIPDGSTFSFNGDKVQQGIAVINSEIGIFALSINCFFLRLVCTNGLISKTEIGSVFRHTSLKILQDFPHVINQLSYELDKKREQFRLSLESKVTDPLATINSFNRQFLLSKEEQEIVELSWPLEAGESLFSIVNVYTRAAQNPKLSALSSHKLQSMAGSILSILGK